MIGGAALALQGIRTSWGVRTDMPPMILESFDVDALIEPHVGQAGVDHNRGLRRIEIAPREPGLLPFTGIRAEGLPPLLAAGGTEPIMVNDVRVLPAAHAAKLKMDRGELKDTVGIILGHDKAYDEEHPIAVSDELWQRQVGRATQRAHSLHAYTAADLGQLVAQFDLPARFMQLLEQDFSGPAFAAVG